MAAKPCDQWHHICEPFVPHGQAVIRIKFRLDLFSYFREEDFWRLYFIFNNMAAESRDQWRHEIFSVDHFIPRWPPKFSYWLDVVFYICNYDVIMRAPISHTHFPWGELAMYQVSKFSVVWFKRYRDPKFFHFFNIAATPRDLWHHNYHWNILHE